MAVVAMLAIVFRSSVSTHSEIRSIGDIVEIELARSIFASPDSLAPFKCHTNFPSIYILTAHLFRHHKYLPRGTLARLPTLNPTLFPRAPAVFPTDIQPQLTSIGS